MTASAPERRLGWEIAARFFAGRRRGGLLDSTAGSALAALVLGVSAMVLAMALLTGYRGDLERKLIGGNAAVMVYPTLVDDPAEIERALARLRRQPGIVRVDRVAYGQGIVSNAAGSEREVTLRGVEAGGGGALSARPEDLASLDGLPGAVFGGELSSDLGLHPGETVRLVALGLSGERPRFGYRTLRVAGSFDSGFSEFDRSWVVVDRSVLDRVRAAGPVSFEAALADPDEAPERAAAIAQELGPNYLVTNWQELNRDLFAALRLQQRMLFLLLGLIVVVATFNVASTLVVLVRERQRDLGVLAALGLPPERLRQIFLAFGAGLGLLGTAAGLAIGSLAAWLLTRFEVVRFPPEVSAIYFLRSVPFRVTGPDLLAIAGFALVVTFLSCWLPARRAARLEPAAALRYE